MTSVGKVSVEVGAKTARFNRAMSRVSKRLKRLQRETRVASRSMREMGKATQKAAIQFNEAARGARVFQSSLGNMGRTSGAVAAGIIAVGAAAFKTAAEFDNSVTAVSILVDKGQLLEGTYDSLSAAALKTATTTEHTAESVGDAMRFMAMAGQDATQVIAGMPAVANIATIANMGLARAADLTTNMMAGFGIESKNMARFMDDLALVTVSTNVNVRELASSLSKAGPTMKTLQIPFQDTAAAVGLLGNMGIKADQAGRGLARMMISLNSPGKEAAAVMDKLGINVEEVAKSGGLQHLTEKLEKARRELKPTEFTDAVNMIFDSFGGRVAQALVGAGSENIGILVENMKKAEGLNKKMAEKMRATPLGQMQIVLSQLKALAQDIGRHLFPAFKAFADVIQAGVSWLLGWSDSAKRGAVAVATLAAKIALVISVVMGLAAGILFLKVTLFLASAALKYLTAQALKAVFALTLPWVALIAIIGMVIILFGSLASRWKAEMGSMEGFATALGLTVKQTALDIWRVFEGLGLGLVVLLGNAFDLVESMFWGLVGAFASAAGELLGDDDLLGLGKSSFAKMKKNIDDISGDWETLDKFLNSDRFDAESDVSLFTGEAEKEGKDFAEGVGGFITDSLKGALEGGLALIGGDKGLLGTGQKEFDTLQSEFDALKPPIMEFGDGVLGINSSLGGSNKNLKKTKQETSKFWELVVGINNDYRVAQSKVPEMTKAGMEFADQLNELVQEKEKELEILSKRVQVSKEDFGINVFKADAVEAAFPITIRQLMSSLNDAAVEASSGATSMEEWSNTIKAAKEEAANAARLSYVAKNPIALLGGPLAEKEIQKKMDKAAEDVGDAIKNAPWDKIPDITGDSIQNAFSKSSMGLLKSIGLNEPAAKNAGKQLGGALESVIGGSMPDMGGLIGGLMGASSGASAITGAIGSGIQTWVTKIGEMLYDGLEKVVSTLLGAIEKFIPESRFTGAVKGAFGMEQIMLGAGLMVAAFFSPLAPLVAMVLPALALAVVGVTGAMVALLPVVAGLATSLAWIAAGTATLVMPFLLMNPPVLALGAAFMLLTGAVLGFVGIFGLFLGLATQATIEGEEGGGLGDTPPGYRAGRNDQNALPILGRQAKETANSFARFKSAFEGSVDRLIASTDFFFEALLPLAGLFDVFVDVLGAFFSSFLNMDAISDLAFESFRNLLLATAYAALGIATLQNVLAAAVIAIVNFVHALTRLPAAFGSIVEGIQFSIGAGMNTALQAILESIQTGINAVFFGGALTIDLDTSALTARIEENAAGAAEAFSDAETALTTEMSPALQGIRDTARGFIVDTEGMSTAINLLHNISKDEARLRAEGVIDLKDANREISEELTNIPDGFKVAAEQFKAISIGDVATVSPSTYGGPVIGENALQGQETVNIWIESVELSADSPAAMADQLQGIYERRNVQRTGSPVASALSGGRG